MVKPSQSDLIAATGISQSYASMILTGARTPARALAIRIYRVTGWRHSLLDGLTDEQIAVLEQIEPWKAQGGASEPAKASA